MRIKPLSGVEQVVFSRKVFVLTKLIFKIIFKAMVPIVCVVGVMSYGMYMNGGDPAAMFKKVLGNSIQSAKTSVRGAADSVQSVSPVSLPSSKTTVYQWVDANGVTQFGSAPPEGVAATAKTYNNNANLVAGVPKPVAAEPVASSATELDNENLPGVAGMDLPVSVDPSVLSEFLQTMQQREQ